MDDVQVAELSVVSHSTGVLTPSVDFDRLVTGIRLSETRAIFLKIKI
jgi:hypothetical protein